MKFEFFGVEQVKILVKIDLMLSVCPARLYLFISGLGSIQVSIVIFMAVCPCWFLFIYLEFTGYNGILLENILINN